MATLAGMPVDRTPVCFYELNGLDERPEDADSFNIYNHPAHRTRTPPDACRTQSLFVRVVDAKRLVMWYHEPAQVQNTRLQCVPPRGCELIPCTRWRGNWRTVGT